MILKRTDWYINNYQSTNSSDLYYLIIKLVGDANSKGFTKYFRGNSRAYYYVNERNELEMTESISVIREKNLVEISIEDLTSIIIDDKKPEVTVMKDEEIKVGIPVSIPISSEFAQKAYKAAVENGDMDVAKAIKENVDMFNNVTTLSFVKQMIERYKNCSEWRTNLYDEFGKYLITIWKEEVKNYKWSIFYAADGYEPSVSLIPNESNYTVETEEEASLLAKKFNLIIDMHNFAKIHNEGWEAHWSGASFGNHIYGLVITNGKVIADSFTSYDIFVNNIRVKSRVIAEKMLKEFEQRITELYITKK